MGRMVNATPWLLDPQEYDCMMSECCIFFSTLFNNLLTAYIEAQLMA